MIGESGTLPAAEPKPLNNYRVRCLNGWEIFVASPQDLVTFCKVAKADGLIGSDKMGINFANVVSIEYVGPFAPQQNVVAGPGSQARPHLQVVEPT